jgi:hypothetical protein
LLYVPRKCFYIIKSKKRKQVVFYKNSNIKKAREPARVPPHKT